MSTKSKTAEAMSKELRKIATNLEKHVEDHPKLRPLIGQITKKADSLVKPAEDGQPVVLHYGDGEIVVESVPGLWPKTRFNAYRFKLAEAKGEVTGQREDGTVMYASSYDKERGKNVLPLSAKEALLSVMRSFFPDSPIQES